MNRIFQANHFVTFHKTLKFEDLAYTDLTIFDLNGKLIYRKSANTGKQITIAIPNGEYIIRIENRDIFIYQKVLLCDY